MQFDARIRVVTADRSIPDQSRIDAPSSASGTYEFLFEKHGPLMAVEAVLPLLAFKTRDAFNRAILKRRLPLEVIRPDGRRQAFVRTLDVAQYLGALQAQRKEGAM